MEEKDLEIKIEEIFDKLAKGVIERARRNLAVTRTRTGYRTKNGVTTAYKYKSKVNASGNLSRSLTYNVVKKKGLYEIKFYGKGTQQYADVIEQGRRPNSKQPPVEPILKWMKMKPIKLRSTSGKFVKTKSEDELRQVAKLIARKIGKYGIEPVYYFKEAIDAELEVNWKKYNEEIIKYVQTKINEGWL
jgi:hypothetical protein